MVAQRAGEKTWLDVVPESYITRDPEIPAPLFVDIGGGVGHQCAALLAKFPFIKRDVVLQDLDPVIAHALPITGVTAMGHDFWADQPIKGKPCFMVSFSGNEEVRELCVVAYLANVFCVI